MGWLDSFFNPGKGYEKSQEQLDKYFQQAQGLYNQGQGYLAPYSQGGMNAANPMFKQFMDLLNPSKLQNEWAANYEESPYAKQLEGIASERGLNAAQAMGLNGSNTALNAIQQGTSQIANQDRQQYMQDLMQKYMAGLGIGQNFYNQGASSAGQMGQNAMNMGQNAMSMGQGSAQNAFGQQNAGGNTFSNLLGLAGSLGAGYLNNGRGWNAYGGR